jgi:hypothetical protein
MKLDQQCFLIVRQTSSAGSRMVELVPAFSDSLRGWDTTSRVSPIITVSGVFDRPSPTASRFKGKSWLCFVGPIHPQRVADKLPAKGAHIWLSLGLFNVIVQVSRVEVARELRNWANKRAISFEQWELQDGRIVRTHVKLSAPSNQALTSQIQKLASHPLPQELHESITEYCPLALATLARGKQFPGSLTEDLQIIHHDHIENTIAGLDAGKPGLTPYQVLGQVLTVNAALSRFSSQTFAGTSPVLQTECHFWSHSLLGIGVATIGLWRLNKFLEHTLGSARLPARVAAFRNIKNSTSFKTLPSGDPAWTVDYLELARISPLDQNGAGIIPLLTYFSGREGFNSTESTISAPLATVSACNSLRWSLLTITHEISHILVNAMALKLYPNLHSDEDIEAALHLLKTHQPTSLLEEVRLLLLLTIMGIDAVHSRQYQSISFDKEVLITVIEHWQREVEEILVHTFDFLWFYGRESDKHCLLPFRTKPTVCLCRRYRRCNPLCLSQWGLEGGEQAGTYRRLTVGRRPPDARYRLLGRRQAVVCWGWLRLE